MVTYQQIPAWIFNTWIKIGWVPFSWSAFCVSALPCPSVHGRGLWFNFARFSCDIGLSLGLCKFHEIFVSPSGLLLCSTIWLTCQLISYIHEAWFSLILKRVFELIIAWNTLFYPFYCSIHTYTPLPLTKVWLILIFVLIQIEWDKPFHFFEFYQNSEFNMFEHMILWVRLVLYTTIILLLFIDYVGLNVVQK